LRLDRRSLLKPEKAKEEESEGEKWLKKQ